MTATKPKVPTWTSRKLKRGKLLWERRHSYYPSLKRKDAFDQFLRPVKKKRRKFVRIKLGGAIGSFAGKIAIRFKHIKKSAGKGQGEEKKRSFLL